jgi:hypothetical protein
MANTKKGIYCPTNDAELSSHLDNVVKQLASFGSKYGTSPTLLATLTNYSVQIPQAQLTANADKQKAKESTALKNNLTRQAKKDLKRELNRITALPDFIEADAKGMGIRREKNKDALVKVKPVISNITVMPQAVVLDYIKGMMDGVVVYSSNDGVGFEKIGIDLRSPFEDLRTNKVAGVPEIRYYKMRYLKNDEQVGQFSNIVSVTVLIG